MSSPLGLPRNREIDFGFVSCSCRACVRAGEAKLRGRARADVIPTLVALLARCAPPAAPAPALFWPRLFLMTVARVLEKILAFDSIRKGFRNIFTFHGIRKGFTKMIGEIFVFHAIRKGFTLNP